MYKSMSINKTREKREMCIHGILQKNIILTWPLATGQEHVSSRVEVELAVVVVAADDDCEPFVKY